MSPDCLLERTAAMGCGISCSFAADAAWLKRQAATGDSVHCRAIIVLPHFAKSSYFAAMSCGPSSPSSGFGQLLCCRVSYLRSLTPTRASAAS